MPKYLTPIQEAKLRKYLLGPPVSLSSNFDSSDFPREMDTEIFEIEPGAPIINWEQHQVSSGRFFRFTHFLIRVIAALVVGHDRYGMFGEPKTLTRVDPSDLRLTKTEYDNLVCDLREILQSIDPELEHQYDSIEFLQRGPAVGP